MIVQVFRERFFEWLQALGEHLQISLVSLLIAIIISIPLAIIIVNKDKIRDMVLQITGIFQTVPSLALLGLLIPIFGIGTPPAVCVLVIYAIFPILQNTVTGLKNIDPTLQEAAEAFGMTRFEKLKKFEIAIAMPVIISGIRTSAVMVIGTATLAALIGAGGLGSFILLGIDRNNVDLILIGAISSALLAILFNMVIKILEKSSIRTIMFSMLILTISVFASFIPFFEEKMMGENIVIAAKLGPEPEIIINMYKELIEQETDLNVILKPNFGKTSFLYEALKSGDIDIYPEFSGTITSSLLKEPPKVSNDVRQVYEIARDSILKQDNLIFLEPMLYQNTYAVAVKNKFAKENNLKNISDLKKVVNSSKAGFTLEFNDREDGNKGIKKVYGINLKVKTLEPSLRYQAINNDDVQIIDAYSTDSELKEYDLVILKDNLNIFPPYQGAPLLRKDTLEKYPELEKVLNKLSGKISEEEMINMNYEVKVKGKSAASVAHDYLKKEGLVK